MNSRAAGNISVEGQSFTFDINGCRLFNISTMLVSCGNSAVLGKFIGTVIGNDICICIFSISCFIACQSSSKLCFRFWHNRSLCRVRAFAVFLIEGDVAALQCCGGSSQAVSNLHITGQVIFAVYIVTVGQLAGQCIQYVGNAVLVVHSNAGIIGNHGHNGTFCSTLDNSVACCVVFSCFTVTAVCIENVGIATVAVNSQAAAVLLEDVACFGISFAAGKLLQAAAMITIIALALIGPLSTVGKQHISIATAVFIKDSTLEIGFIGIHAKC